jgi:hypothetical protein
MNFLQYPLKKIILNISTQFSRNYFGTHTPWTGGRMPLTIPLYQYRSFRKHKDVDGDSEIGRSVNVKKLNVNRAYGDLRKILMECKVKDTVFQQKRFESNPMRRKRKRREREWKSYLAGMKTQVKKAFDLKTR